MKSAIAAVGLLASLASASVHPHPPRQFHWRRDNTTAPLTTLTVEVTQVSTVTSCAPTITNCPAASGKPVVVTNVVVLTETVCPVTEAAGISSSLVQQHSNGGLPGSTRTAPVMTTTPAAPVAPLNTAGTTKSAEKPVATQPATTQPPVGAADEEDDCPAEDGEGEVVTTVTRITTIKTLTMTVGKGSSASVVTTAIPGTVESTVLITVPAAASTTPAVKAADEPTTTVTATSTGTRTVTIKRPHSSGAAAPSSPVGDLGSDGECSCPAPVTVTVSAPASTVYVTMGAPATTPAAGAPAPAPTDAASSKVVQAEAPQTTPAAGAGGSGSSGSSDEEDDCPADEDDVVTLSTTVTVAPFPTNGTKVSGAAKPTGLVKRSNKLY